MTGWDVDYSRAKTRKGIKRLMKKRKRKAPKKVADINSIL